MGKDKKKSKKSKPENVHIDELAKARKKKGGKVKKTDADLRPVTPETEVLYSPEDIIAKADEVIHGNSSESAIEMAKAAKKRAKKALAELEAHKAKELLDPEDNPNVVLTDIGKKLRKERHEREAEAGPDETPEDEKAPVIEYVRDPEVDAEVAAIKERVKAKRAARAAAGETDFKANAEEEVEYQTAHARGEKAKKIKKVPEGSVIVELATENGREFMAEPASAEGEPAVEAPVAEEVFVDPNVAVDAEGRTIDPILGVPVNGRKQPLILDPESGKLVAYSRVTTFIDKLDDKTALTDWKLRTTLAGVAFEWADETREEEDSLLSRAIAAAKEFEKVGKKLDKLDAAGKLGPGERGSSMETAEKTYKKAMDAIVSEALDIAGAHEKANHGTELHRLCEVYDAGGWDALRAEDPSPADFADVSAYVSAMEAIGITRKEVVDIERRVVIDEHHVTGTFDRGLRYKPLLADGSGRAARSVKVIGDIKTGRIDYGAGKIATQIGDYVLGKGYDPETGARENLGYNKKLGLLIHLPAGKATCVIYEVDLTKADEGLKTLVAVDAWRKTTTEARAYRGEKPFYREVVTVAPGVTPATT